ncbi:STAS domain-containing protein [Streptomyces otsuchiensis]|uniref:STAS domain-containing protein n=1 Tax=Streptomyces otsuchiensis TaxID=2681388 RepID=UPI0013007020|nr:STAS domain-containing protein [Streptomyces otsuchiensis]
MDCFSSSPTPAAAVTVTRVDRVFTIAVSGEIDIDAVGPLEETLSEALRADCRCTVLDLSRLGFADSTLLGILLSTTSAHQLSGRPLAIAGPFPSSVWRVFTVTGTADHLPLADSLEAAYRLTGSASDPATPT